MVARMQADIDRKLKVAAALDQEVANVYEVRGEVRRQVEVVADPRDERFALVVCRVCSGAVDAKEAESNNSRVCWRFGVHDAWNKTILHKVLTHCGHFKSTPAVQHRQALARDMGWCSPSAERSCSRRRRQLGETPAGRGSRKKRRRAEGEDPPPAGPRLQIYDVNSDTFVDIKRDRGRAIRYHRITRRLGEVLDSGFSASSIVHVAARALVEMRCASVFCPPPPPLTERVPLRVDEVMELMCVLLELGLIDKLPVTRAADVRALADAKEALPERMTALRVAASDSSERRRERRAQRMAILFVAHQLWTPSRMRRLVDGLANSVDSPPTSASEWGASVRRALELGAAEIDDVEAHQEIAMENDVFTGRHRGRTTATAVLQAGWPDEWDRVLDVAGIFVDALERDRSSRIIDDAECRRLVEVARRLPDVGPYIGAHLVRSLLGVYDLRIPLDSWGAFTMSESSVGDMLDRLRPLGLATPAALADVLAAHVSSPRRRFFLPETPDRYDAGALALILCETHSCCALVERHRTCYPGWNFQALVRALRDTPRDWPNVVRRVLVEEYGLPFDPDVVYHPACKVVFVTMLAKKRHQVHVCRLKPPKVFDKVPRFKVVVDDDDDDGGLPPTAAFDDDDDDVMDSHPTSVSSTDEARDPLVVVTPAAAAAAREEEEE
ncbi:hypothetical protein CTAYLR_004069 [Chrysophaeum taylorii]|uniref:Uncharacterized protein n=1 Tax=Chrysophaeum taylorii TaxID=2483200 RepID=A0AAD7XRD4_9STRA|nr:hypothetical protein CTAYLR_004069 [Chrysophaeum taylorii]